MEEMLDKSLQGLAKQDLEVRNKTVLTLLGKNPTNYDEQSVSKFIDALNEVLPLFGITEPYVLTEKVGPQLPASLLKLVLMVGAATEEADIKHPAYGLLKRSGGLEEWAAFFIELSTDKAFKGFLSAPEGASTTPAKPKTGRNAFLRLYGKGEK